MKFNIVPVFFNVGVDEEAEVAERCGLNGPQEKNNSDNFKITQEYIRKFKQKNYFKHISKDGKYFQNDCTRFSGKVANNDEALIDDLMDILKREVTSRRRKNTDILTISSLICQKLSGLRFTSCRDGLARSTLAVSLEQARLLTREYDLKSEDFSSILDTIRSEGLRRGKSGRYNLTTMEVRELPPLYRPPLGSYGPENTLI